MKCNLVSLKSNSLYGRKLRQGFKLCSTQVFHLCNISAAFSLNISLSRIEIRYHCLIPGTCLSIGLKPNQQEKLCLSMKFKHFMMNQKG